MYENLQGAMLETGKLFFSFSDLVGKGNVRSGRCGRAERFENVESQRLCADFQPLLTGTPMNAGDSQAFRTKTAESKERNKRGNECIDNDNDSDSTRPTRHGDAPTPRRRSVACSSLGSISNIIIIRVPVNTACKHERTAPPCRRRGTPALI